MDNTKNISIFRLESGSYRTVIDIHFFSIRSLTFYFLDSNYLDSILKNCASRIFSHVPHYVCGWDPKILTIQTQ